MSDIPRSALYLGLAGLLPFLWGVGTAWFDPIAELTMAVVGPRFLAPFILIQYGTVILAFMSGVLWGFATKAEGQVAATGYALSVIPALYAYFLVGHGGAVTSSISLITAFIGLLGLDWLFWNQGLAPPWWMTLRVLLTAIVVACLGTNVI
ncbi:MAG: DUF3429 domain-containing protein [Pseudomonadota bacterium]